MVKEFKMSQARYDELKKELDYSKTTRADEIAELIKEARGFGDLSENSEYDEAKNEQGKLYSRIAELSEDGRRGERRGAEGRHSLSRRQDRTLTTTQGVKLHYGRADKK